MVRFLRKKISFGTPLLEWQYYGIYCPNCIKGLYDFTRRVKPEEVAHAKDIRPKPGIPNPQEGQKTCCPACGYDWLVDPLDRLFYAHRN